MKRNKVLFQGWNPALLSLLILFNKTLGNAENDTYSVS